MGKVVFEVSCHVRDRDEVGDGVRMHACQSNIYWKRTNMGTNSRKKKTQGDPPNVTKAVSVQNRMFGADYLIM